MGLERSLGALLLTRSLGHVPRVALESCAPTDASRAMGHFLEEEEDGVRAAVSPNVMSRVPAPFPQTLTCRQLWLSLKGPQERDSPNTQCPPRPNSLLVSSSPGHVPPEVRGGPCHRGVSPGTPASGLLSQDRGWRLVDTRKAQPCEELLSP